MIPNLVWLGDKNWIPLSQFVDSNELLIPKLTKIRIEVQLKDIQLFETFVKNDKNWLKSVSIDHCVRNNNKANVLIKQNYT